MSEEHSTDDPGEATDATERGTDRKERVIHTRVPAVLEQELKRLAQSLRVPVSNVVRAILEDAVEAVDVVGRRAEGEMRTVAERLASKRDWLRVKTHSDSVPPPGEGAAGDVIGYQPMVLASAQKCGKCGCELEVGTEAFIAIRKNPAASRLVIGRECLPSRAANASKEKET